MKRTVALGLVSVLVTACHLYFEQDEDADADPTPVPASDAAPLPVDCVPASSARAELFACFDFAQWESLGLCEVPNMRTMQGTCATCHAGGGDGIQLSPSCQITFDGFRLAENFEDLTTLDQVDRCVTTATVGKICSSELIGGEIHPPFVCPNNIRDGIQEFLDTALAAARAGDCTSP